MTTTRRLIGAAALGFSVAASGTLRADDAPAKPTPATTPPAPAKPGSTPTGTPAKPSTPAQNPPAQAPAKPTPRPSVKPPAPEPTPPPVTPKVRVSSRRGQILPEGAFLVSRRGELVPDPSASRWGGWTFRFDSDANGASEAPMVLMPCARLEAMQRLADARAAGVEYTVSGQVFVYQGRNFLLPVYDEARAAAPTPTPTAEPASEHDVEADPDAELADEADASETPETRASAPAPAQPTTPAPAPGSPEEEVQRRLKALDSATHDRRRIPTPPPPAPSHDESGAENVGALRTPPKRGGLLAEGTYLASRRGRLVREAEGAWVMRFDADARGQVDPPMRVLPCMNLDVMERIASVRGDAISFIVSGQVYVFEDQNYFLPALYRVGSTNPDLLPPR